MESSCAKYINSTNNGTLSQDITSSNSNHVVSSTTNIQQTTTGKQTSQHHLDLQRNVVHWVDKAYKILKEEKVMISNSTGQNLIHSENVFTTFNFVYRNS